MGLATYTMDLCKAGIMSIMDSHWVLKHGELTAERQQVQYSVEQRTARIDFDGYLFLHNKSPKLEGRLTVWPYIGKDKTTRHYDVTATVQQTESSKTIEEGKNKGTWLCLTERFKFDFKEVENVVDPPYAKVIEIEPVMDKNAAHREPDDKPASSYSPFRRFH
ncbi:unnamed protein product [Caenorhabditis brenneri]